VEVLPARSPHPAPAIRETEALNSGTEALLGRGAEVLADRGLGGWQPTRGTAAPPSAPLRGRAATAGGMVDFRSRASPRWTHQCSSALRGAATNAGSPPG